jgi:hypothetical protein
VAHQGTFQQDVERQALSRPHLAVVGSQLAAVAAYVILLFTDAPPPFSLADWLYALAPPALFALTWSLGRRLRVASGRAWLVAVTRISSAMALTGFVVTTLLLPIWLFGSWMDKGIG